MEALENAIVLGTAGVTALIPGAVIARLGTANRTALEHLTSDMAANVRPDAIFGRALRLSSSLQSSSRSRLRY